MSNDRDCDNCIHRKENGCEKWDCKFEPKSDCISRQAVLDELNKWDWQELYLPFHFKENIIDVVPSVNPQEPKTGHCKDCKYFEYDSVAKVDGIPLIVAHEICSRWGDGCKTKEDGYCFLYKPQESEEISECNMKMWEELFKADREPQESEDKE